MIRCLSEVALILLFLPILMRAIDFFGDKYMKYVEYVITWELKGKWGG